jgi:hypothetical protein
LFSESAEGEGGVYLPSHGDGLHLERYDDEEPRERI